MSSPTVPVPREHVKRTSVTCHRSSLRTCAGLMFGTRQVAAGRLGTQQHCRVILMPGQIPKPAINNTDDEHENNTLLMGVKFFWRTGTVKTSASGTAFSRCRRWRCRR